MSEIAPEGATTEPVAETPAEPSWTGPSQEEWQATQEQLSQYAQTLPQQQPQYTQPEQGPPIPDPFAEDYADQFRNYVNHVQEPLRQWQQQIELSAAQEQAMSTLAGLAEQGGQFDTGMAWARANQIVIENGGDPHKALEQAAKETREYERRVGEAYHQQQIQQLQGVAGAPRTIPAGMGGAQTVTTGGYGNVPNAVTARMFGQQR